MAATETRVDENSRFGSLKISAIASGAAAKDRELNCHGFTIEICCFGGNVFPGNERALRFDFHDEWVGYPI